MDVSMDSLCRSMDRLKLKGLAASLDDVLKTASDGHMTPEETLAYALGVEVERRESKRLILGLKLAHFPRVCTLEDFDFSCQPSIDQGQIRELARMEWVAGKKKSSSPGTSRRRQNSFGHFSWKKSC